MQERPSRLSRTSAEKTKKQIIFFVIAIIVFLFIAFQFGPRLLNAITSLTSGFRKPITEVVSKDNNTLETPFIDSIPNATDSASIVITGSSTYSDAQVELYVNDALMDTVPLTDDQKFKFESVRLTDGQNIIRAKVKKGDETSDYTRSYYVTYSQGAPKLEVSSPSDNQEFKRGDQTITVQGTTDPDNTITVNGFRAIVDETGSFSYNLNLSEGDNELTIKAQSASGKETEKKLKVTYHP